MSRPIPSIHRCLIVLAWILPLLGVLDAPGVLSAQENPGGITGPTITILTPDVAFTDDAAPQIAMSFDGGVSGIDFRTLDVRVDGIEITSSCDVGETSATCVPAALSEGLHQVDVSINDLGGNTATDHSSFTVDLTPPVVSVDLASNQIFADGFESGTLDAWAPNPPQPIFPAFPATSLDVSVAYSDALSGVDLATLRIELDGVEITSGCTVGPAAASCRLTDLAESAHALRVTVDDIAGGSMPVVVDFVVDLTPPTIAAVLDVPANAAGWHRGPVTVSFVCDDALAGVVSCPDPVTLSNAGAEQRVVRTVTDLAGHRASVESAVSIDLAPPSFDPTELRPAVCPAVTTDFLAPVQACFGDDLSGADEATVRLSVDGVDQSATATVVDGCVTWNAPERFTPGDHQAVATVEDLAGNVGTIDWCFTLASLAFDVVIEAPLDGFVTGAATIDVRGTVDELAETVEVNGVAATLNAGTFVALGVPLVEGLNELVATASSSIGGIGLARVLGAQDSTPPEIEVTIDPPPNAEGWNSTAVTVSFECSDDLSGVDTCPAPVFVDTEGAGQQLDVTATDLVGNSGSVRVDLNLDLTPPSLVAAVDPAANPLGWHTEPVTVSYSCEDTLSGVESCPPPFLLESEGAAQPVVATVEDLAGHVVTLNTPISLDLTAPIFDSAEQRPDRCPVRTTDLQAQVRACFADPASGVEEGTVMLEVDGLDRTAEAVVAGGCVTWNPPASYGPGEHQARIVASNGAGQTGSATWCFDIDSPPIGITIDTPSEDLFTTDGSIDVFGTVEQPIDSVTVNGVAAEVSGNAYQVLGLALHEGRNEITAVARNAAGNTGSASRVVVRDTTAPVVRIETPRDGAVLTSLQVDVAGLVNDLIPGTTINADDCQVTINGVEAAVANRSFLIPDLLLKRGLNTLTAVARDRMGNERSHSIEVMVEDRAGQRIVLLAGNNQDGTVFEELSDPLVVALVDANGDAVPGRPVSFKVSRGNGTLRAFPDEGETVTVLTDDLGLASVRYVLGNRSGAGNNRVLATAPGFLGEVELCATALPTFGERVIATAGDQQRGVVEQELPQPLVVLVTDVGGNPVAGVDITFEVLSGGGGFGGVPPTGVQQTVVTTDLDGLAEAALTLGVEAGVNNNVVQASFSGLLEPPASFSASGLRVRPPGETQLSGVVLDNQDNPIEGVTLRLEAAGIPAAPSAVSDVQGRFTIGGAPVGAARLIVDGSTTTRPGNWPTLVVDVTTIAGGTNELGQPIWLLPLADNEVLIQNGGPPQDVTLRLPGVDGAEITIFASSVFCPSGQSECRVSWTQVRGERLPMDPPQGSSFMLAGTFQPSETHYDPPARLCIPNADQAPGAQVEMFSFDHDLGEFIAIGTATVTDDGAQICSDPGFGLVKGGWHGCVPPPPPCTSACGDCPEDGDCFTYTRDCPQCGPGTCNKENKPDGTFVSNDDPGDCFKEECKGGSPSEVGDPSESPGEDVTDHECKKCGDNGPEADPDKDGTIVDDCKICENGTAKEARVELSGVPDKLCVGETVQITARVTPDVMGITGPNFESDPEISAVSDGNNQTAQLTGVAPGHAKKRELKAFFGSSPGECDTKTEELFVLPLVVEGIPGKINRFTEHSFLMDQCPDYPMQNRTRNHDIDGCSGGTSQDPMLDGGIFFGGAARRFNQAPTTFGAAQAGIPFGTAPRNLPCNNHDVCYQTCGSTQVACDNGMRADMDAVCARAYPPACPPGLSAADCVVYADERDTCFGYSGRYFRGLRIGGSPAWTQRQTQYCLCCEP